MLPHDPPALPLRRNASQVSKANAAKDCADKAFQSFLADPTSQAKKVEARRTMDVVMADLEARMATVSSQPPSDQCVRSKAKAAADEAAADEAAARAAVLEDPTPANMLAVQLITAKAAAAQGDVVAAITAHVVNVARTGARGSGDQGLSASKAVLDAGRAFLDGDEKAEESALREAVAVDPENSGSWLSLGMFQEHHNNVDEAENAYHKAVQSEPANAAAWSKLGSLREDVDATQMIADLKTAVTAATAAAAGIMANQVRLHDSVDLVA